MSESDLSEKFVTAMRRAYAELAGETRGRRPGGTTRPTRVAIARQVLAGGGTQEAAARAAGYSSSAGLRRALRCEAGKESAA